ncbi:hypothetical protein BJV77DRAFT_268914 [Russula vinacea]|nr:hypothetical protein BJV77DRAFT_268914 [Russula vinacea]
MGSWRCYARCNNSTGLFSAPPQLTTRNVLRPYALHVLFVPPAPAPGGVSDGMAAPVRDLHFRCSTFQTLSIVTELSFGGGGYGKITVLRYGFDTKACGAWMHDISFESGVDSGGNEAGARKQCAVLLWDRGPENYDENTRRADRDPHGFLCSPMDASAPQTPTARPFRLLGSSTVSLRALDRTLANMEGGGGSRLAPPRV